MFRHKPSSVKKLFYYSGAYLSIKHTKELPNKRFTKKRDLKGWYSLSHGKCAEKNSEVSEVKGGKKTR